MLATMGLVSGDILTSLCPQCIFMLTSDAEHNDSFSVHCMKLPKMSSGQNSCTSQVAEHSTDSVSYCMTIVPDNARLPVLECNFPADQSGG